MRLGRIHSFDGASLDEVKAQGLSCVEFCRNDDNEAKSLIAAKEQVLSDLARTGIQVSAVGRWNHHVQKDGKLDLENVALYRELLDTAVELGAKTFVCGCNYDKSTTLFRNYSNAIEFFNMLTEHAGGRIRIALQNCDWENFVTSPKQWDVILPEVQGLGIKFDPSHAYNRGEDYLGLLSDYGEYVYHIHIKGTVHAGHRRVDDPPAGMDDINWSSFFAILYSLKYDGDLSIEPHSGAWLGERAKAGVLFTRDYIRKFII